MKEEKGFYFDFENDPDGIITETVSLMLKSVERTSEEIPDRLLKNLFNKTNIRNTTLDKDFMCELFDTLYTTNRFLRGLPEKELSQEEFQQILLSWHILLWIETLRRKQMVSVTPFPIFDFDHLPDTEIDLRLYNIEIQKLMN
ncbi:MAG: hypothetical protein AAF600_02720 [Bacteroidota bacterium]